MTSYKPFTRICLLAFFVIAAHAQLATTTSLVGTVADSSGKGVSGAAITATETRTLDKYNATTNEQGYYTVEFVRVGVYSLAVEHAGFQKVTNTGIVVDINQTVRTDITMPVGLVSQSVTVQSVIAAIKTDDASVSEILGTRAVADLPLNGRDAMSLAATTPGVIPGIKSSNTGTPPGEDFNGAGTREIQNSLSLDGISIMNNLITTTPTRPMIESIQEVEVQTGTYSAQYGAYLGVHVNMVTKAGTNQFHGAAVEFLRNQVLDARAFFTLPTPANPTAAKPPLRQNQFGVEFDGPVMIPKLYNGKDKTFFMASYEGYRLTQSVTGLSTEMPAAFFTGNFSGVPASSITGGAIKDPLNGNTPFAVTSFPVPVSPPLFSSCSSTIRDLISQVWRAITRCQSRPPSTPTRPSTASIRISARRSACMPAPTIKTRTSSAATQFPPMPPPRPLPLRTTRWVTRTRSPPIW